MSNISLKKNIAFTTSSQMITMAASFVINWFLARYLGPELRGKYVYLFTVNSVVWMLLDLGVSKSQMYSLQREKADPNKLYSYFLVFFALSLFVSMGVFYFFGSGIMGHRGHSYSSVLIMALATYIAVYQLYTRQKFMLIGLNHINDYVLINISPTIVFMILLLPMFWMFPKAVQMQCSYLLNVFVLVVIIFFFHFRLLKKISFRFSWDWALVFRSYGLGFKAFLSEYMALLMSRVDILMLKQLGGFSQLGVYMLAINFLDMINITASMIGIVLLNKFASMNNDTASLAILRKIFIVMLAFDLLCIIGMVLFGLPIIRLLYGYEYQNAWYAFIYLIPAIIGITIGGLFNTFLWSKGFPIFTIIAPALATIGKFILSYFLIPRLGLFGAAISSSIIYPMWFVSLMIWYFSTHKEQSLSQMFIRKEDITQIWEMVIVLKNKVLGKA
jgi:O-antigen/teichoic acid export membrane protein